VGGEPTRQEAKGTQQRLDAVPLAWKPVKPGGGAGANGEAARYLLDCRPVSGHVPDRGGSMVGIGLLVFVWVAVIAFVLGCVLKGLHYALTPMHLRWDLYPVAHEPRRDHGGSYLEEKDWWTHKRRTSLAAEVGVMGEEIVLLKGVWQHNRSLWWGSLPFHWGLYLLVVTTAGLVVQGLGWSPPVLTSVLPWVAGVGGFLLLLGSAVLLIERSSSPKLRPYTTPLDRLNLLLLLAFGAASMAVVLAGGFGGAGAAVTSILRFRAPEVTFLLGAQMALGALFVLYMPYTRMAHFFAKYFTYHKVRWDDRPYVAGGPFSSRLEAALEYGMDWSAPHIQSGHSWRDVVTHIPQQDEKGGQ
jgi:nitrate reductase gamma subunit